MPRHVISCQHLARGGISFEAGTLQLSDRKAGQGTKFRTRALQMHSELAEALS